jgi:hypothetical protein
MNEQRRVPRATLASAVENLRHRTDRIEQILPTLATKKDLEAFATKEDLKAFATKEDLKAFATKEDLKAFATMAFVREEGERTRRHVDVRFEQLRDQISAIAEGHAATTAALDRVRREHAALDAKVERHRLDHVELDRRVRRLEDTPRGRKARS